jgi:site-specific DNA-methyltransferase (adenine-specific)
VGWQDWWSKLHPVYDALPSAPSTVMDIFNGSGTSGVVALQLGRNYIGIDLSEPYIEMARKRIEQETDPLFSKITVEKI